MSTTIILALASVAGVGLLASFNFRGAEADPVRVIQKPGLTQLRDAFEARVGVIQPIEVVDVGTQVSGQLSNVWVKPGDRVISGQLLAEIDDRRIKARFVQGEAAVDTLRAQIIAKQAQLAHARTQQIRMDALNERNVTSRAQAELAHTNTVVLAAELRSLEAQLAGQEAALEGIRLDLEHTRITAPTDGVVTSLVVQRGLTVNANQKTPVILQISRDRPLILVASVPEADIQRIHLGMQVRYFAVGAPSRTFEGIVDRIMRAPTIINNSVFYDVVVELDGEPNVLPFGRTVQVSFIVDRLECAILLPRRSLPDNVALGAPVKIELRNQAGVVAVHVLPLQGFNESHGAISCDDADKAAGINSSDE